MPEHARAGRPSSTRDEVGDLVVHAERPGVRARAAVAAPVVAQHAVARRRAGGDSLSRPAERSIEPCTSTTSGASGVAGLLATRSRVDASRDPHDRSTSVAAPLRPVRRAGEHEHDVAVLDAAVRARAVSTANQTISSLDVYSSTCTGSTPHDSDERVHGRADRATARSSRRSGRKRAIARAVRPLRVQHRIAVAPASIGGLPRGVR